MLADVPITLIYSLVREIEGMIYENEAWKPKENCRENQSKALPALHFRQASTDLWSDVKPRLYHNACIII